MTGLATGRDARPPHGWRRGVVALTLGLLASGVSGGCSGPAGKGGGATTSDGAGGRTSSSTTPTRSPTGSPAADGRLRAASALVAARAAALGRHDRGAWLATVSDPTSSFAADQGALYDRMSLLPVGRYGEQGVETGPPLDDGQRRRYGDGAWVASVRLVYELTGYDRGLRTVEVAWVLVPTADGWRLAGVARPGAPQPWDLSPLTVLRLPSTLVVGNAPARTLRGYLALADAAHSRIAEMWGTAVPAVVVVPKDATGFGAQLRRPGDAGLAQVAAVTDGPLEAGRVAGSDRVYVNPTAFRGLTEAGQRVVLTHELTHVTVRATTTRAVPGWLSEGFAEQVGYATVSLPPTVVAAELLARVRAGQGPTRLPTDADLDPAGGVIAPVYNAAWLAVTLLASRFGEDKVVAFYRAVAGVPGAAAITAAGPDAVAALAFPAAFGVTEQAFTTDWLASVRRLAA